MAVGNCVLGVGGGEMEVQLPGVQIIFAMKFSIGVTNAGT